MISLLSRRPHDNFVEFQTRLCGVTLPCFFQLLAIAFVFSTTNATAASNVINASEFGVFDDTFCRFGFLSKATDQTSFLRTALAKAAKKRLVLPRGAKICLNSPDSTLRVSDRVAIDMNAATIRWNAPLKTPAAPIIDFLPSADGFELSGDGLFDGQSDRIQYLDSDYFGSGPYRGGGDAIVSVQANGTIVGIKARAAFDSCIQIAAFDTKGLIFAGHPEHGRVENVSTTDCGMGEHGVLPGEGGPGKGGAGVNNGSGANWVFTNLRDEGSYQGFGCDVGAGAGCHLHGFTGTMTKFDARYPAGPTGNCLYNGARSSTFEGVHCFAPGLRGLSSDGDAANATFADISIYSPARECIEIKGHSRWDNVLCVKNNDSPAVVINNLQPHPISVEFTRLSLRQHRLGIGAQESGLLIEGNSNVEGGAAIVSAVGFSALMKLSGSAGRNYRIVGPTHGLPAETSK